MHWEDSAEPNLEDLEPRLRGWLLCFRNRKLVNLGRMAGGRAEWSGCD